MLTVLTSAVTRDSLCCLWYVPASSCMTLHLALYYLRDLVDVQREFEENIEEYLKYACSPQLCQVRIQETRIEW